MQSSAADELHAREREFWNGPGGERWVRNQERTDAVLAPVASLALERAKVAHGFHVVDVGCGCGATTIELGRRVGTDGAVLGLDVSAPMLAVARRRLPAGLRVEFVADDAATHPFRRAGYDLLFSRFGVMFFGDPAAAFANLRAALRPQGRVHFACWRPAKDNPWMMVPLHAAYAHVPPLPKPGPDDPGPFSFGDETRVKRILEAAGFADVMFEAIDLELDLASDLGLDAAVDFALEVGATSRAIQDQPPATVAAVAGSVRKALEPFQDGSAVRLKAAIWLVSGVNP